MTSPCPFPLLPPPKLPPPGSLLHGSSDSGFGNEATVAGAATPAAATAGSASAGVATSTTTVPASPDVKGTTATLTRQDSVREEDEEQEEQPRDNVFSSVKLKKVLTDDRSAPMIT